MQPNVTNIINNNNINNFFIQPPADLLANTAKLQSATSTSLNNSKAFAGNPSNLINENPT